MKIPKEIKNLLKNNKLCSMATCWDEKPYLSLMNFTYLESEDIVILSSRKNSKKYTNIQKNKNISLLIFSDSTNKSATFLGTALTLKTGDNKEEYYRKMHIKNCEMPQFILGENINLIIFKIEEVIVSDREDNVKYIG
ncbi:pyridoxamine 5'-phosphate oxidase family protein [Halanaerobium sp.]|uniref:pyridoxamine 5'-phosphate oxidase family protein n=1 Tax=Halanaerobium sp. TaxID=1895664 RepID=UPI000DE7222D|nr:pyridoxamine 5'-phosphate oxidase family protein [Halanaerobium sp.]PUU89362.1 MAG: pyridoxamine 5'-phosphate oxidase-related FMN-binding protein [Halanaerobium sp.]